MATISLFVTQLKQAVGQLAELKNIPADAKIGICCEEGNQSARLFLWPGLDAGPAGAGYFSISCPATPDAGLFSVITPMKSLQGFLDHLETAGEPVRFTTNGEGEVGLALSCGELIDALPAEDAAGYSWILTPATFRHSPFKNLGSSGDKRVYFWWGFSENLLGPSVGFRLPGIEQLPETMKSLEQLTWLSGEEMPVETVEAASDPITAVLEETVGRTLTVADRLAAAEAENGDSEAPVPEKAPVVIPSMGKPTEPDAPEVPPEVHSEPKGDPVPGPMDHKPPTTPPPPEATGKRRRRTAEQMEADRKADMAKMVETLKAAGYAIQSPEELVQVVKETAAQHPVALTAPPEPNYQERLLLITKACTGIIKQIEELSKIKETVDPSAVLKKLDLNALVLQALEKQGVTSGEKT